MVRELLGGLAAVLAILVIVAAVALGADHYSIYVKQAGSERPETFRSADGNRIVVQCPDCGKATLEDDLCIKIDSNQEVEIRCPHCKSALDMSADNSMFYKTQ